MQYFTVFLKKKKKIEYVFKCSNKKKYKHNRVHLRSVKYYFLNLNDFTLDLSQIS